MGTQDKRDRRSIAHPSREVCFAHVLADRRSHRSPIGRTGARVVGASAIMRAHQLPLAQTRGDQQVLADAIAVEAERSQRLGDALDAFALQGIARGAPTEQDRGQK